MEIHNQSSVAVISADVDDFIQWKTVNGFTSIGNRKKFTWDNTTYHCITSVKDLHSNVFNSYIEAPKAKENNAYDIIINLIKSQIIYNPNNTLMKETRSLQWNITESGVNTKIHWATDGIAEWMILDTIQMTGRLPEVWLKFAGDTNTIDWLGTYPSIEEAKAHCKVIFDDMHGLNGVPNELKLNVVADYLF